MNCCRITVTPWTSRATLFSLYVQSYLGCSVESRTDRLVTSIKLWCKNFYCCERARMIFFVRDSREIGYLSQRSMLLSLSRRRRCFVRGHLCGGSWR